MIASDAAKTAMTAARVTSWPMAGPTALNCSSVTSPPNLALIVSISAIFSVSSMGLRRTWRTLPSPNVVTAVSLKPAATNTSRRSAGATG